MQNQDNAAVSTSIFLLAGLGLASGYCANEALAQIECMARRLLRAGDATRQQSSADGAAAIDIALGGRNTPRSR
jgi:hypothetical protein